jgi:hypothetical protein
MIGRINAGDIAPAASHLFILIATADTLRPIGCGVKSFVAATPFPIIRRAVLVGATRVWRTVLVGATWVWRTVFVRATRIFRECENPTEAHNTIAIWW